jgi:hypothetical protein
MSQKFTLITAVVLFSLSQLAWGEDDIATATVVSGVTAANDAVQMNTQDLSKNCDHEAIPLSRTSVSLMHGNGYTFAPEQGQSGGEHNQDIDLRLSHQIGDRGFGASMGLFNFGHDNVPATPQLQKNYHHEDGGYLQATESKQIGDRLTVYGGLGGFLSMDTTLQAPNVEVDQKGFNLMGTVGAQFRIYSFKNTDFSLQFECNGILNTNTIGGHGPNAFACVAGGSLGFGVPTSRDRSLFVSDEADHSSNNSSDHSWGVDAGAVYTHTNHGAAKACLGEEVDVSKYWGHWVGTVGLMTTGDDDDLNADQGFTLMVRRQFPITASGHTRLETGAGVYLERDLIAKQHFQDQANGMLRFLGLEQDIGKHGYGLLAYDRMFRTNNASTASKDGADADMLKLNFGLRW